MDAIAQNTQLSGESLRAALWTVKDVTSHKRQMSYTTSSRVAMSELQRTLVEDAQYHLLRCTLIEGMDGVAQFIYVSPDDEWPYWVSLTYHEVGEALPELMLLVEIDGRWQKFAPSPHVRYGAFGSDSSDANKVELKCKRMYPNSCMMWVPNFSRSRNT